MRAMPALGRRPPLGLMLALTLVLAASLAQQATAVKELSAWDTGILTHYGGAQDSMNPTDPSFGSKEGACGYGLTPKDRWPYFSVAALATSSKWYKADELNGCGQCFQIQCVSHVDEVHHKDACIKDSKGNPKSILVQITDECPECGADHIDVQSLAFAKLMNPALGRMNIKYRRVECTPPEDLKVSVMDFVGTNGWLRLSISDTGGRGTVTDVHIKSSSSGSWLPMTNTWGAAWELSQAPQPPLDFKITTDDGEEVVANSVIKQNGGISQGAFGQRIKFQTNVQFTITDPAVTTVRAASGPDEDADPMVATSDTPGNGGDGAAAEASSLSLSPSSGSSTRQCADIPPPGGDTCQQKKDWGQCSASYMVQGGYCAKTCTRCEESGGQTASKPTAPTASPPTSESSSSPAASSPSPANLSPSPSASPPPAKPASAPQTDSCTDVNLSGFTCQQQKDWGKCNDWFLVDRGYCNKTCGRCTGSGGGSEPSVQSFSGPADSAPGGRKLLAGGGAR